MTPDLDALERRISAAVLRLRARAPFFAVLAMFAPRAPCDAIPTAATDGRRILYNPRWLANRSPDELEAVWLHEVLHAALLHALRCGTRDRVRWNIAADVVVNGIVALEAGLTLPPGAIRAPTLEHLPVEEVYELLDESPLACACPSCLVPGDGGLDEVAALREAETHWRRALLQAEILARQSGQGSMPASLRRHAGDILAPTIDWRAALWRFVVRTPVDYADFDRRFVHRGLYLETLTGEQVEVYVAIDTSGSVDAQLLAAFLGELVGILASYPSVRVSLYYVDAAADGPYVLDEARAAALPPPTGGGGTSFVPFFEAVERERERAMSPSPVLYLYMTDGHGRFPSEAPRDGEVLWLVSPGGALAETFPFGEVTRLQSRAAPG